MVQLYERLTKCNKLTLKPSHKQQMQIHITNLLLHVCLSHLINCRLRQKRILFIITLPNIFFFSGEQHTFHQYKRFSRMTHLMTPSMTPSMTIKMTITMKV